MPRTRITSQPDRAGAPSPGSLAAIEAIEARLRNQIQPQDAITAILIWRVAVHTDRLDCLSVYNAAMTARRVRYARVNRENERRAEAVAVARTLDYDPTTAVRKLRQTPEGMDWLIREWDLLEAEVAAGLDPLPEAWTVHNRAQHFLGLHNVEQDGGEWATHCKALETPSFQTEPEEDRAHRDWVASWAADHARTLRRERTQLDHAAEEEDRNEATARALFDPGPDAERMRRCEVNADRSLLRTIRELERIRARAAKAEAPGRERTQSSAPAPGTSEPIAVPAGPATWRPSGPAVAEGANPTVAAPPAR